MTYLPGIGTELRHRFPDIAEEYDKLVLACQEYDKLARACQEWGPLDEKARRLVKLGIAIGLSSDGEVRAHARRALDEGITEAELRHAVLLAFPTAGYPTMITAMKWVEEVIEKEGKKGGG